MRTSQCPGTPEAKGMLQKTVDRVGARIALLIGSDGEVEACVGLQDRFDAEVLAGWINIAVRLNELEHDGSAMGAYVTTSVDQQRARAYVRRIEGGRLLVTVFVVDDTWPALVRGSRAPDKPSHKEKLALCRRKS